MPVKGSAKPCPRRPFLFRYTSAGSFGASQKFWFIKAAGVGLGTQRPPLFYAEKYIYFIDVVTTYDSTMNGLDCQAASSDLPLRFLTYLISSEDFGKIKNSIFPV